MGVSSFWVMLTNPFYVGLICYKGEVVQGSHEPLVDKELFNTVEGKLRDRNLEGPEPEPPPGTKEKFCGFLLSFLALRVIICDGRSASILFLYHIPKKRDIEKP